MVDGRWRWDLDHCKGTGLQETTVTTTTPNKAMALIVFLGMTRKWIIRRLDERDSKKGLKIE
jgi:hypothetical protein